MFDAYLLLTPILMLGVLALVRFVGCDLVFPVQGLLDPPQNVRATPLNAAVQVSWDPLTDSDLVKYVVKRREAPGDYTVSLEVAKDQTMIVDSPLTNGTTYFYVVAGVANRIGTLSDEVSATPAQGLVRLELSTLGTLRNNFTGFVGMLIRVAGTPLSVVGIGRIFISGNSGTHVFKIVDAATQIDVPNASVTLDFSSPTLAKEANKFSYAYVQSQSPVLLAANTNYFVVSAETVNGDQWLDNDTKVTTSPDASVTTAVFGDGVTPFIQAIGSGNTFGPVDVLYR